MAPECADDLTCTFKPLILRLVLQCGTQDILFCVFGSSHGGVVLRSRAKHVTESSVIYIDSTL